MVLGDTGWWEVVLVSLGVASGAIGAGGTSVVGCRWVSLSVAETVSECR